jgi:hypothetical protein
MGFTLGSAERALQARPNTIDRGRTRQGESQRQMTKMRDIEGKEA